MSDAGSTIKEIAAEQILEAGKEKEETDGRRHDGIHEIVEAFLLAVVAITTAFGGYQAARWDSQSAQLYGMSSQHRTAGAQLENTGGQYRLYDAVTFNGWLTAVQTGNLDVAPRLEARFRPEFKVAFDAWMKTDPFNNPGALPGPMFMPEYHVSSSDQGAKESLKAESLFDAAAQAREHGDDYVRMTVFLAAVLFLITVGQRFRIRRARSAVLVVAMLFTAFSLYTLATFPHL